MFEVRVTADFAAAHFLQDYNGKCENLHGHNYKVYAHVKGNQLNEGGMLLDHFSEKIPSQSLRLHGSHEPKRKSLFQAKPKC